MTVRKDIYSIALTILLTSSLMMSCIGLKNTPIQDQLLSSNCNQHNAYSYTADKVPPPIHELTLDASLRTKLSFKSLNMANAIGALDWISQYIKLQQEVLRRPTVENRLAVMEIKQQIDHRINLSSLEVSAVSSELDCEEERTSQVANYLKGKENDFETKLTVGAIVVGASGAVSTGVLITDDKAADYVGLATGVTEATLGMMMLFNKRTTDFYHERNTLKEIWDGEETSASFPPSVWYYLKYYDPKDGKKSSVRNQIITKWMTFGQIDNDDDDSKKQKLIELYFGKGGRYSTEQLENRADMYDQLESHINLMKQDLKGLSVELDAIVATRP